jgi:hypothetical protein
VAMEAFMLSWFKIARSSTAANTLLLQHTTSLSMELV